jgi:uncharacterized protein
MYRSPDEPAVGTLTQAIQAGALDDLARLLDADPELARCLIGDERQARGALHVATDFPGHFPNTAAVIGLLVERGADVDARFVGPHRETPLHWAASCDDVDAIDALVAAGADIEADGAVLTGGSPLDDAVVFGQWNAARRLYELGAQTKLFHAAALGRPDRVQELLAEAPDADTVTGSLWHACQRFRCGSVLRCRKRRNPTHLAPNDQLEWPKRRTATSRAPLMMTAIPIAARGTASLLPVAGSCAGFGAACGWTSTPSTVGLVVGTSVSGGRTDSGTVVVGTVVGASEEGGAVLGGAVVEVVVVITQSVNGSTEIARFPCWTPSLQLTE